MDEKKKVIEDVDKDRRYAIDAAVVRTMKSRKVCAESSTSVHQSPKDRTRKRCCNDSARAGLLLIMCTLA